MDEDDYEDLKHEDDHLWTIKVDHNLRDLQSLGPHRTWIQKLHIMCDISDPSFLQYVDHVKEVKIFGPDVTRIDYLPELKSTEKLEIKETSIQKISGFDRLPALKSVAFLTNEHLVDFGSSIQSDSIENFVISASIIRRIPETTLKKCTNFGFAVGVLNRLADLLPRLHLPEVDTLWLANHIIERIEGLDHFPLLKKICFANNRISKLEGFDGCPRIETIDVVRNPISDISGILKLRELQLLQIDERARQLLPKNFLKRVSVDIRSSISPKVPRYIEQNRIG